MLLSHIGYLQAIHLGTLSISSCPKRFWGLLVCISVFTTPLGSLSKEQMFPRWPGSTCLFWPTPWAIVVSYGLIIISSKSLWGRFSCFLEGVIHILFMRKKYPTVYHFCTLFSFFLMILTLPPGTWALGIYRVCGRIWNSSWCHDASQKIDVSFFFWGWLIVST